MTYKTLLYNILIVVITNDISFQEPQTKKVKKTKNIKEEPSTTNDTESKKAKNLVSNQRIILKKEF
jgi:hypothetical protein